MEPLKLLLVKHYFVRLKQDSFFPNVRFLAVRNVFRNKQNDFFLIED